MFVVTFSRIIGSFVYSLKNVLHWWISSYKNMNRSFWRFFCNSLCIELRRTFVKTLCFILFVGKMFSEWKKFKYNDFIQLQKKNVETWVYLFLKVNCRVLSIIELVNLVFYKEFICQQKSSKEQNSLENIWLIRHVNASQHRVLNIPIKIERHVQMAR